jgi:5'-nucleotidase
LKIVLTNDDGLDAPGIQMLSRCVQDWGHLFIVAPADPQSGIAHRVTTRTPIRVIEIRQDVYRVAGTPADCSRISLKDIVPHADWVISGINPGANLGSDVYNSGTVAAAREAAILGCRAISISQYIARDQQIKWNETGRHAKAVLKMLLKQDLPPLHFWNVNLPHAPDNAARLSYQCTNMLTEKMATNISTMAVSMNVRGTRAQMWRYVLIKEKLPSPASRSGRHNYYRRSFFPDT